MMKDMIEGVSGKTVRRNLWANLGIYSIIILLAVAAYFFEPDYMAHVPVRIGICAYDSVHVAYTLGAYADYIRKRGGGDISWKYFEQDETPDSCHFYLMTSVQLGSIIDNGRIKLSMAGIASEGCRTRGVVITRSGVTAGDLAGGRFLFSFRDSATGFLSPLKALRDEGVIIGLDSGMVDFAGCRCCDEKVIFGVLFGRYIAGGMSIDKFRLMESMGMFEKGELSILLTGPPVIEIVLASSINVEPWKYRGFTDRLQVITENLPGLLKSSLKVLGIAGFVRIDEKSLDFPDNISNPTTMGAVQNLP